MKTWVEISKKAVRSNVANTRKILGKKVLMMAVVKGDGYGAGTETLVRAIHPIVDWFGVDSLDEAKIVRKLCRKPVLILGYTTPIDAADILEGGFSVVLDDYHMAVKLSKCATKKRPARIHIKVDTGLIRLGLFPQDAIALAKKVSKLPNVFIEGIYTHYAELIDKKGNLVYADQLEKFNYVVNTLADSGIKPPLLHTASSVAAFLFPETRCDMVRIGIPLHGLWSRRKTMALMKGIPLAGALRPIMSWKTTVVNIKKISAGTGVGYGRSEIVKRDTTIAVLGAGFYDGIDKRQGKIGEVLIRGTRARMVGSIAMNMCTVDATNVKNLKVGDSAILIGRCGREEISVYDIAELIGTNTYEVISTINSLLPRVLVP